MSKSKVIQHRKKKYTLPGTSTSDLILVILDMAWSSIGDARTGDYMEGFDTPSDNDHPSIEAFQDLSERLKKKIHSVKRPC